MDLLLDFVLNVQNAPAVAAPVAPAKKATDSVHEAIAVAAGTNSTLRKTLGAWARKEIAEGRDREDVTHEILNWPEADE